MRIWDELVEKKSKRFSSYLKFIRSEIKEEKFKTTSLYDTGLIEDLIQILSLFPVETPKNSEQIYILSTRANPDILKIGFTTRSVVERVHEINSATGVLVPFGVRAVWRVKNAQDCEKKIHNLFSENRIRNDREFFKLEFRDAFSRINRYLSERRKFEEL